MRPEPRGDEPVATWPIPRVEPLCSQRSRSGVFQERPPFPAKDSPDTLLLGGHAV